MMRLQGLITRARWRANNITADARYIADKAKKMGIKAELEPYPPAPLADLCKPILRGA